MLGDVIEPPLSVPDIVQVQTSNSAFGNNRRRHSGCRPHNREAAAFECLPALAPGFGFAGGIAHPLYFGHRFFGIVKIGENPQYRIGQFCPSFIITCRSNVIIPKSHIFM